MGDMATRIIEGTEISDEELALARRYPMVVHWSPEYGAYVAEFPGLPGIGIRADRGRGSAQGGGVIVNYVTALLDAGRQLPEPVALEKIA